MCPAYVCVRVEKPGEVTAVAVGSGYMCVVHAGQLTLALSPLSSSLISFSLLSHPQKLTLNHFH